MKVFLSYLKRHVKVIALFLLFQLIAAAIVALYDLPMEATIYTGVLCAAAGIVFFGVGFCQYYKKHRLLTELGKRITIENVGLPVPKDIIEEDYIEMLEAVCREKAAVVSRADASEAEAQEYYLLWAHQIKTPIAAMRLILQMKNEDGDRISGELSDELFRIEQYVEMVLQYQRLEGGNDLVLRRCSLEELVKTCLRKYARQFIRSGIALTLEEFSATILTDEKWLSFVIEQIISNSLKYARKGKVFISFADGVLTITDTGIGISAEDLPRVTEWGYTGFNGRTDKKSTGIGLYLCKRICGTLGHTLRIESEQGKGTKVHLSFQEAAISAE